MWKLKLACPKSRTHHYDFSALKTENVLRSFDIALMENIEKLNKKQDDREDYEKLMEAVNKSCERLPTKPSSSTKKREVSKKTMGLIEERRRLQQSKKSLSAQELKVMNNQIAKSAREDTRAFLENLVGEIEQANVRGNTSDVFRLVKKVAFSNPSNFQKMPSTTIDGEPLTSIEDLLSQWEKFLEEKFKSVLQHQDEEKAFAFIQGELEVAFSENDFNEVVKNMKCQKAPGVDGIPVEVYKYSNVARKHLMQVLRGIWISEKIPSSFAEGMMLMFFKKGDKNNMGNYRPICLLPHAFKIFTSMLLRKIAPYIDSFLSDAQAGFRPERGCRDNVLILNTIIESALRRGSELLFAFIDFKAAFDSIDHGFILRCMRNCKVPNKLIRLVNAIYNTASAMVRIQSSTGHNYYSKKFNIRRGVLQGDTMSPLLFILGLNELLSQIPSSDFIIAKDEQGDISTNNLAYADDAALLFRSQKDASRVLTSFATYCDQKASMSISENKTKTMIIRPLRRVSATTVADVKALKLPFVCGFCGKTFASSKGLKIHKTKWCFREKKEPSSKLSEVCNACGFAFASKKGLRIHTKRWCNKKKMFQSSSQKCELSTSPSRSALGSFMCTHCGLLFSKKKGIIAHESQWCGRRKETQGTSADKMVKEDKHRQRAKEDGTVEIGPNQIENVLSFTYLGCKLQGNGDPYVQMEQRMVTATAKFLAMKKIWNSSALSQALKLRLYACIVGSIATYSCESWRLDVKATKKIRGFNRRLLSWMLGSSIVEETKNPSWCIIALIKRIRHRFLGHLLRMQQNRLLRRVFVASMGAFSPYPQGSLLNDWVEPLSEIVELASDRITWQAFGRQLAQS